MDIGRSEAKVTIAKLLEIAYSKDKGLTAKIMASAGSAKLSVDTDGKATLSGSAGVLTFSGEPALKAIGAKLKRVSVSFTNASGMKVGYSATFSLEWTSVTVSGQFDLEALILACSGLLCRAARGLKAGPEARERELNRVMGY